MRLIVSLLSMIAAGHAWGEWVKYAESNGVTQYYDPAFETRDDLRHV